MRPFQVGPWTVFPDRHEFRQGEEARRVGAKVMAVLCQLAQTPGQVVRKETLVSQVWQGDFASDEALSAVVYELRKALGDDAREPRFIETIRKSGFRLVAPVSEMDEDEGEASIPPPEAEAPPAVGPLSSEVAAPSSLAETKPRHWEGKRISLAAGLLAAALLVGFGLSHRPTAEAAREVRSLAVLPVSSYSPETSELLLAEALTEMLIADLAQVSPLEIASGLSVRSEPRPWNLDRIAAELGVDAVLEGSVLRSQERYWISVQLVETGTGRLLWGASYDRQGTDSLSVLRGVALDVARQVQALLPEP